MSLIVAVLRLSALQSIGILSCNNIVMELYHLMYFATEVENEFVAMDKDLAN